MVNGGVNRAAIEVWRPRVPLAFTRKLRQPRNEQATNMEDGKGGILSRVKSRWLQ
jgi:hypothetical protein